MDFSEGILFLEKAREKEIEAKLYFRWCAGDYQKIMSFNDFKEKIIEYSRQPKELSVTDILKKVKYILDNRKE